MWITQSLALYEVCDLYASFAEHARRKRLSWERASDHVLEFCNELGDVPTAESLHLGELQPDEIIAELCLPHTGRLPVRALRAAQRHRDAMTPRLIEVIRQATESVRKTTSAPQNDGHLFALFLLTEFAAQEALPAILEAVSLRDKGPFRLFGDALTVDFCGMLAALTVDRLDVIDGLIANRCLNPFVRGAAAGSHLHLVRDGVLAWDQAIDRLCAHLREANANRDSEGASQLVAELVMYESEQAQVDIREAFRLDLVDESVVDFETARHVVAEDDPDFQYELQDCGPTGVADTVETLSGWMCFSEDDNEYDDEDDEDEFDDGDEFDEDDEDESYAAAWGYHGEDSLPPKPAPLPEPIRKTAQRVGRNEPCPCGSGKKFKACCGGR